MLRNRTVILAKVEPTYGQDALPDPTTDAILCELPEFSVVSRRLERNNVVPYMGKLPPVNIGEGLKIKFTTELKGSGTAVDTPPEIGVLFRGCNFTETINTGISVDYEPNSALGSAEGAESLTIYFYQHNILHKMLGCRGTFSLELKAGEYGKITWEFTGLYGGPVDSSIPTPTVNQTLPPRFLNANFSIDGYAAVIDSLSLDIQNEIAMRPDANSPTGVLEWMVVNREPKGQIDPEVVALSTKNFWQLWENSSQIALSATVGTSATNKCVITAPKVVLDTPSYEDRNNILIHGLPFTLHPDTGDDEIKFSFQ